MRHVKAVLAIAVLTAGAGGLGLVAVKGLAAHAEERSQAETYAAAGAKLACSCVHVAGRDLKSCSHDTTTDLRGIKIIDANNVTRATARNGRVEAVVRFDPGLGCTPVKP